MKIQAASVYLLSAFIVFQSFNCKQTEGDTIVNDPEKETAKLTAGGWQAFELKEYPKAVGLFQQALIIDNRHTDAFTGLGWAYGRMNLLENAKTSFDIALGLDKTNSDAIAGRSFVSLAQGRYDEAITNVGLIERNGAAFYIFRHDTTISLNDLKLVKAQSYFMLGRYLDAQFIIDKLDPSNGLDPSHSSYIEDLALEIENLWKNV